MREGRRKKRERRFCKTRGKIFLLATTTTILLLMSSCPTPVQGIELFDKIIEFKEGLFNGNIIIQIC